MLKERSQGENDINSPYIRKEKNKFKYSSAPTENHVSVHGRIITKFCVIVHDSCYHPRLIRYLGSGLLPGDTSTFDCLPVTEVMPS